MEKIADTQEEKAILVGVGRKYAMTDDSEFSHLEELALLTDTAGASVAGVLVQARDDISSAYYLGKGKAEELKIEVEEAEADMVIFDNDLTPAQLSNLEKLLDVKVLDRSGLILDIFALRARTRQARTQVELAQLKYLLPRLTRQWTHLSRQQGGIGTRGPGETQLEVDRRAIRRRIARLEELLDKIGRQRDTGRKGRRDIFKVALVGYTNAGKSTLLNALTDAGVPVEDKLFKTLDSVTRLVRYENSRDIVISDTVGFIRNLPHDLIASFKSTLDEVRDADLLLNVVDVTNPEWEEHRDVVERVLAEIGVQETKCTVVFNKIDGLSSRSTLNGLSVTYPGSVGISAENGEGLDELKSLLSKESYSGEIVLTITVAPGNNEAISSIYRYGNVIDTTSDGDSLEITFSMDANQAKRLNLLKND